MVTTPRAQLHQLVDKLPESELEAARHYLEYLQATLRVPRALVEAPEETEPISPTESAALAEADAQVRQGEVIPDAKFEAALAKARLARHASQ